MGRLETSTGTAMETSVCRQSFSKMRRAFTRSCSGLEEYRLRKPFRQHKFAFAASESSSRTGKPSKQEARPGVPSRAARLGWDGQGGLQGQVSSGQYGRATAPLRRTEPFMNKPVVLL